MSVHQSTGSVSSDSLNGRSISPAPSDESRSVSPPAPEPPKRPGRKRRPAPKPPGTAVNAAPSTQAAPKDDVTAFHSRTSSDSSGYHEASVLSESTDARTNGDSSSAGDTLPRRSKLPATTAAAASAKGKASTLQHGVTGVGVASSLSRSMSNLTAPPSQNGVPAPGLASQHSASTTSLASQGGGQRKKKAAPPPPSAPARRPVQLQPSVHVIAEINEAQSTPSRVAVEPERPCEPPQPISVPVKAGSATDVVRPVTVPVKEVATEMPIRVTARESPKPVHVPVQATRKGPPTVVDINVEPAAERKLSPPTIVAIHREEEKTPTPRETTPPPTVVAVRRVVEATVHADAEVVTPRYLDSLDAASAPASLVVAPAAPAAPAARCVASPPNAPDVELTPTPPRPTPRARAVATPTPPTRAPPLVVPRARRRDADVLPRVVSVEMKRDSLKALDVDLLSDADSCSLRSVDSIEERTTPTPTMSTSRTEPEVCRGAVVDASVTSLTSLDEVPAFLRRREDGVDGGVGLTRWDNVEELHDRPTFLLGDPETEEAATWEGASTPPPADDLALSGELSGDWEYTLPAPPTAFRDLSSPSITEFGTVVLADTQVFLDTDADTEADTEVVEPEPEPVKIETPRVQMPITKTLDVVKATPKVTPKASPADSWEPQQLATPTETTPTPTLIGDVRTRPDGVTREVYKVNPLFEASRRPPPPGVATLGKFAPDERELLERSKTLVSRSAGADPQASPLLKNFTISSYATPKPTPTPTDGAEVTFRKPAVPAGKPLLRTNSAAGDAATRGVAVKRATSYLSLARPYARPTPFASIARAQSISSLVLAEEAAAGALRKAASEEDVREGVQRMAPPPAPLQSVQLLRSILGQSQTAIDAAGREADERDEVVADRLAGTSLPSGKEPQPETTPTPTPTPNPVPAPTPVSASPAPTPAPTTEAPTSTYVYRGPPAINFGSWSERPKVQVSLKSDKDYRIGGTTPALRRFVEDKVLHRAEPRVETRPESKPEPRIEAKPEPRIEPKPLTMRIVSQSYKPSSEPTPVRPSSHSVDGDVVDAAVVSRLPIVRAVELKKPAAAAATAPGHFVQLRNTSSTLLNGDAANGNLTHRHSVDVASLQNGAAKRYTSVVGVNGGVAAFGGGKPMPTVKGFRTGEVVQPLKTINGAEHNVRATSNWAQRGAAASKPVNPLAEPATVVKFKKPAQRPLEKQFTNPRDALMDAIKNFGGQDALKLKSESSG